MSSILANGYEQQPQTANGESFIKVNQVTVRWPEQINSTKQNSDVCSILDDTLVNVSLTARPCQLIAIVGHVGSGKVNRFDTHFILFVKKLVLTIQFETIFFRVLF